MKKRNRAPFLVCLCAVIVFTMTGCTANADLLDPSVDTEISEMGLGTTVYTPPEKMKLSLESAGMELQYDYTIQTDLDRVKTTIAGDIPQEETHVYQNAGGYSVRVDSCGRVTALSTDFNRESDWIAAGTDQQSLLQVMEDLTDTIGVDLNDYPNVMLQNDQFSYQLRLYQDQDSAYTNYIHAEFDTSGKLLFVKLYYSDVESLSADDETYFASLLDEYLDTDIPYTVSTAYSARDGKLLANYSVSFTNADGENWVENYIASKSLD